jgi:glucokinase
MTTTLAVGIDVGGTNTSFGITDEAGKIHVSGHISTAAFDAVEDFVAELNAKLAPRINRLGRERVVGAGIGAPNGNFFTGEIVFAPNLPWKGVLPLAKLFEHASGLPTVLTNDAKAATIGEMIYGAAKGINDFIVVTLGTGLGSGFVANGRLIYGHDGLAGELGHVTAVAGGRLCNCGKIGCLERYVSATGIAITAAQWLQERTTPSMLRDINSKITSHDIFIAASKGDALALEIFDYTASIFGTVLADAVAITSPQKIILFGGLAHAGDLLLVPLRKYFESALLPIYRNKIQILTSTLQGADAAILGASALVWENRNQMAVKYSN